MRIVRLGEQPTSNPLEEAFERLRARRWAMAQTGPEERIARLNKLKDAILARREELAAAIGSDFRKPRAEVESTEVLPVLMELAHTVKHLKGWMKPRRVGTPLLLTGTRGELRHEPKGVVCLMAPWNYPFLLLLNPLVAAIAAGNVVMAKPSEKTPATSAFLAKLVRDTCDPSEVVLVEGGADVGEAMLQLPFDHFFFTGGPRVGRRVMEAAAKHLASVTLELGGKSPVLVDAGADVKAAAERVVWGKFVNAGQTCIAPDYVLVHASREEAFLSEAKAALERFYGKTEEARKASPDYCRIVDDGAFKRLSQVLDKTVAAGARVVAGGSVDASSRYIAPSLLADVTPAMPVMEEEIFGPLLPVLRYEQLDEALTAIRAGGKPLALYVFSEDEAQVERVLRQTSAGGTVVNGVLVHTVHPDLPFGGVGESGMGAYHGEAGFRELSHARAVLRQGRTSLLHLFFPPYTNKAAKIGRLASRLFE
jgi:aldehyde dehydrogenase (NAD+)